MNDRMKKRFWQAMFVMMVGLSALMATGCGVNTWIGIGKDMQERGAWIVNTNIDKDNKRKHGEHQDLWMAGVKKYFSGDNR